MVFRHFREGIAAPEAFVGISWCTAPLSKKLIMETNSDPQCQGGITNFFQGATIHNLVINGNMNFSSCGSAVVGAKGEGCTSGQVAEALRACKMYLWGYAAYGVVFCVCRDVYHVENNASLFERRLCDEGFVVPEGTINSAMKRNRWMKLPIDKWPDNGARKRVLKLCDAFREKMDAIIATGKA